MKAKQNSVEIFLENLLKIINALLDKHILKKQINKTELKTRSKPWSISGNSKLTKSKNKM